MAAPVQPRVHCQVEIAIRDEIDRAKLFSTKYLEEATFRPYKAKEHVGQVSGSLKKLKDLVEKKIDATENVDEKHAYKIAWRQEEFELNAWLEEYVEKADNGCQDLNINSIEMQAKDEAIRIINDQTLRNIRKIQTTLSKADVGVETVHLCQKQLDGLGDDVDKKLLDLYQQKNELVPKHKSQHMKEYGKKLGDILDLLLEVEVLATEKLKGHNPGVEHIQTASVQEDNTGHVMSVQSDPPRNAHGVPNPPRLPPADPPEPQVPQGEPPPDPQAEQGQEHPQVTDQEKTLTEESVVQITESQNNLVTATGQTAEFSNTLAAGTNQDSTPVQSSSSQLPPAALSSNQHPPVIPPPVAPSPAAPSPAAPSLAAPSPVAQFTPDPPAAHSTPVPTPAEIAPPVPSLAAPITAPVVNQTAAGNGNGPRLTLPASAAHGSRLSWPGSTPAASDYLTQFQQPPVCVNTGTIMKPTHVQFQQQAVPQQSIAPQIQQQYLAQTSTPAVSQQLLH